MELGILNILIGIKISTPKKINIKFMCGIAGVLGKKNIPSFLIKDTLKLMKSRGPNFQNYKSFLSDKSQNHMLHSRLSIIDLHPRSNQPMTKGHLTLIYNGEIYNYLELKKKLIKKKNYIFSTNSDSEIILNYFLEYGENCVNFFEGMWSFSIWDSKKKKLFLSRDRFGEKPLYYYKAKNCFYYGSEIKYIRSLAKKSFSINDEKIKKFLSIGYKSLFGTGDSFFKEINELKPGFNLTIDKNFKYTKKRYWVPKVKTNKKLTLKDSIKGTKYYLRKSLKLRLRSDVPIAFCLSGGIDSSLLASLSAKKFKKKIATYSIIDKDKRYNELENISVITNDLKCKNKKIYIDKKVFEKKIKKLVNYHECPISTISYYLHSFLLDKMSKDGFKVSISGTGADELFTGYFHHFFLQINSLKSKSARIKKIKEFKKYILPHYRNSPSNFDDYIDKNSFLKKNNFEDNQNINQFLKFKKIKKIKTKYSGDILKNKMLNELLNEVVPVILHHDDLNSMANSIENR
ncbi:asparagine synthase (glutamine-hydrolyzing), partial [Candidatus Pelagibacter bacterium]